eukprot:scaffold40_cov305-Pinguiococcus_pyrenoidosus.AAC.29
MAAKMAKGAWAKGPPKLNGEPPKAVAVDAPPAGATEAPAMPKMLQKAKVPEKRSGENAIQLRP